MTYMHWYYDNDCEICLGELLLRNPPFISFFENQLYIYYKSTFLYKLIIDIPLFSSFDISYSIY